MASNNPAFAKNPAFNANSRQTLSAEELNTLYSQPSAERTRQSDLSTQPAASFNAGSADPMTYEDTLSKTAGLFVILLICAAVGWAFPLLAIPGAIAGLIIGIVATFKKRPSVPLYVAYAACEGLFVGGISSIFEAQWPGIVTQAVLGTLCVFAVTLLLFRSGKVRTSPRATKVMLAAMIGYALFSLVNFGLMMFNVPGFDSQFGARDVLIAGIPLGVIIGLLAVAMAAYCLVMDFEFVQKGVESRLPREFGWTAAFGLMVTIVWLYLEILRIIAILRGND